MKKSLVALLLCTAMLISLAACRQKKNSETGSETGTTAAQNAGETETAEAGVLDRLFGKDQTKEETVITDGNGDEQSIKERISYLKELIPITQSDWDRERIQSRLVNLFGLTKSDEL